MEEKIWKAIDGYENYYEVSTDADVRGLDRVIKLKTGQFRQIDGKPLKARVNNCGYWEVRLSKDGITKTKFLHRQVAQAFIPNPENLPQVNHLRSKAQNGVNHIEWSEASANAKHAYDTGLNSHQGEKHFMATSVVDNELGRTFGTIKEWCAARGINYSTGRNVLNGHGVFPKCIELNIENIKKIKAK